MLTKILVVSTEQRTVRVDRSYGSRPVPNYLGALSKYSLRVCCFLFNGPIKYNVSSLFAFPGIVWVCSTIGARFGPHTIDRL